MAAVSYFHKNYDILHGGPAWIGCCRQNNKRERNQMRTQNFTSYQREGFWWCSSPSRLLLCLHHDITDLVAGSSPFSLSSAIEEILRVCWSIIIMDEKKKLLRSKTPIQVITKMLNKRKRNRSVNQPHTTQGKLLLDNVDSFHLCFENRIFKLGDSATEVFWAYHRRIWHLYCIIIQKKTYLEKKLDSINKSVILSVKLSNSL